MILTEMLEKLKRCHNLAVKLKKINEKLEWI
jgi:hypothetical protein